MSIIRFYFKKGKWHVTSDKNPVPAVQWWAAINEVKCMNHRLREQRRKAVTLITPEHGSTVYTGIVP